MTIVSETVNARFERVALDLLEVRLKSAVHIDEAVITGIMAERRRLCGNVSLCVLVLVPSDAALDINVVGMDHYKNNTNADGLRAVAVVCGALALETMARLYAAYFPPMFRFEVFNQEGEARSWLQEQLAQVRQAGQKA
ncbi:MAG: STAS/SEC14 domain-containing protein [Flavobacteriales bacterium]|nr:STAS/SEC14 domain-containing protein [Flavobacteriales bacterium]